MAKAKKKSRKSKPIVIGHLEKVSRGIFDKYKKQITNMIKGHHGVYALYRRNSLYYIGLAGNLKNRIKTHLKDKHGTSWSHFSLYIFKKDNQIREFEALLIRIAYPEGNKQRGKLKGSKDLKPILKQQVKKQQTQELDDLFKGHKLTGKKKTKSKKKRTIKNERPLKGIFSTGKVFYATYKGKEYKAWVNSLGRIKVNNKRYDTPSAAANAIITRGAVNGWNFWKYKDKSGKLRKITVLRK